MDRWQQRDGSDNARLERQLGVSGAVRASNRLVGLITAKILRGTSRSYKKGPCVQSTYDQPHAPSCHQLFYNHVTAITKDPSTTINAMINFKANCNSTTVLWSFIQSPIHMTFTMANDVTTVSLRPSLVHTTNLQPERCQNNCTEFALWKTRIHNVVKIISIVICQICNHNIQSLYIHNIDISCVHC